MSNDRIPDPAVLYGTAGRDATERTTQSGKRQVEVSIALYTGKEQDGSYRPSTWARIRAYGAAADALAEARKGDRVTAAGQLTLDEWTGRDGAKRTELTLTAFRAEVEGRSTQSHRPPARPSTRPSTRPATRPATPAVEYDDDLPY